MRASLKIQADRAAPAVPAGSNPEIQQFCETRYGVTFDMFGKLIVKGEGQHPLFAHLVAESGGDIVWNFNEFLVGKDGEVLARFAPTWTRLAPSSPRPSSGLFPERKILARLSSIKLTCPGRTVLTPRPLSGASAGPFDGRKRRDG